MKQEKLQEITDISDYENVDDTSDMDAEARKIYFMSTIVGALLTAVTAWTFLFMCTDLAGARMLLTCIAGSMVIPVVFFSIFKIRESGGDYLKIVPCLRYTSRYNWIMTGASMWLVIYGFIRYGFYIRMPGGVYTYAVILALCFLASFIASNHASKAYDEEEPFHAMLATYTNDNTILWWAAVLGIATAITVLVLSSDWFNT